MTYTLGIVQARMGSTRLPGKVLRKLGGRTVLERVVRSAFAADVLDELVVATSVEDTDDAIEAECARLGVPCTRGPVDDVLTRVLDVLDKHPADTVLRFTADCPLLDPAIVTRAARVFAAVPGLDYLTTSLTRTLPRGLDVEVARAAALYSLDEKATGYHRTHVTSYLYTHPDEFDVLGLTLQPDLSHLRLTLDTEADWKLIEGVVAALGDDPAPLAAVAKYLGDRPELAGVNAHVRQKELAQA